METTNKPKQNCSAHKYKTQWLMYMSEERANCTVREKKSIKINLMIGEN